MDIYRTIKEETSVSQTIERSHFIAPVRSVESREEAEEFIAQIRAEYRDATHNVPAMVLGDQAQIQWASDDGEPQGTAGHPMLDVLTGAGLVNTLAVVTRYFGGTLLGTGGLVRSYTKALQDALEKSILIERKNGIPLTVTADDTAIGKLEYFFAKEELPALSKEYGENVKETLLIPEERLSKVQNEIIQMTGGKAVMDVGSTVEYAVLDGTVLTGEQLTG